MARSAVLCPALLALAGVARGAGDLLAPLGNGQVAANETGRAAALQTGLLAVEQADARIPVGGTLRLLVVGSSNTMWNTWIDQLHMMLSQLGYEVPLVDPRGRRNITRPDTQAICDNHDLHKDLHTLRISKPGWSSWGFAYESMDDCDGSGFRTICNHSVSCVNGWQCQPQFTGSEKFVRPSDLALLAAATDVVVLSNWQNDVTARFQGNNCYRGLMPELQDTSLTVDSLLRTIRAIHAVQPGVAVIVLAKYPGAAGRVVGSDPRADNAAVRQGLSSEPNTFFADFNFPIAEDMYLTSRSGHPNCRGDKVIASAIVEELFAGKIIARGLALGPPEECLANSDCNGMSSRMDCCQRSALCWPSAEGQCVRYSSGLETTR